MAAVTRVYGESQESGASHGNDGFAGICPKPKLSRKGENSRKYPYLLDGLDIQEPDKVWCDEYDSLYLPFPVMLSQETANKLNAWVDAGGTLVCEGCPGYFGDRGHVGTVQPNLGLDELFGVRESYVEFTQDLLDGLKLHVDDTPVGGGILLQACKLTTGTPIGW